MVTIHYDPIVTSDAAVGVLRARLTEKLRQLDPALSLHDLRIVPGRTHTNVLFDLVLPAGYAGDKVELLEQLEQFIKEQDTPTAASSRWSRAIRLPTNKLSGESIMLNETYRAMLGNKSVIRETFMYGKQRAARSDMRTCSITRWATPACPARRSSLPLCRICWPTKSR